MKHLQGLIAAPFTPMNSDESLNISLIHEYYKFLKNNRVTGAFICGSTGEGVSMTLEEKKAVALSWANCTRNDTDFKVILLVGGTCLSECKELANYALKIGIYAIAYTSPFYFKPTLEKLAWCCFELAASVPSLPVYYYHIPALTGVDISMIDLLKEVDRLDIQNFAGIKFTHEDFMDYQSCLNFSDGKYDMLWGRDENLLSALVLGAKGGVGSTYNYAAPLYNKMIDAYEAGDIEFARVLQQKSIDMIRLLGKYGGIATGKAYMKLVGLDCGQFRLPVGNMSGQDFLNFSLDVESLGFNEFKSASVQ